MTALLLAPLILYFIVCAGLYFAQASMIFPAGQVGPADPAPARAGPLEIAAATGERLRGIHIPPASPNGQRLLLLGFAGNGWNAQSAAVFIADLVPEADVVVFHYRGYPPSEGAPGAAALIEDAPRLYDFAVRRLQPARTVAIGFSIGTGVAASLAAQRPLDGLILVTPFDSLGRVAAGHFPWLPVRLLLRHEMEPARDLATVRASVALIAGGSDTLIPPVRTDGLRHALPNLAFDRTIAGAGHNDIYRNPAFRPAFREALARLSPPR